MIDDARRAIRISRYYVAGSIALAAGIFLMFPGAPGAAIAIVVLLQGLAFGFVTRFWAGFAAFSSRSDWAAGHAGVEAQPEERRRSQQAGS